MASQLKARWFWAGVSLSWAGMACSAGCSSSDSPANAAGQAGTQGGSAGDEDATVPLDGDLPDAESPDGALPDGDDPPADPDGALPDAEEPDAGFPLPCGEEQQFCCGAAKTCNEGLTCSDQFCLHCGPPPLPREGCMIVSAGATPSAQQTFPQNPLSALNDGEVCEAWSSGDYPGIGDSGVGGTWLALDLGAPKTFNVMSFWVKQTPAHAEVSLSFAYSSDGVTWTPWEAPAPVQTLDDSKVWQVDVVPAITAQHFKVTFLSSPSFVSMRELSLYDCPAP